MAAAMLELLTRVGRAWHRRLMTDLRAMITVKRPVSRAAIQGLIVHMGSLKEGRKAEDLNDLLKQITKAFYERAMRGEMTAHLG